MAKNSGMSPINAESPIASAKLAQPADLDSDTLLPRQTRSGGAQIGSGMAFADAK